VLLTVPSLGILLLQNNKIQTYLTSKVAAKLSENLHARITVEAVSITFINRLQLKNLYIEDQNGDTLLFAGKINAALRNFSRSKKEIVLSKVNLEDAYIHFIVDTSGVINLRFILDQLISKEKTDSSKFSFQINNAELKNSRFHFTSLGKKYTTKGVNYADMDMRDLNFSVEDFGIKGDTVAFSIIDLSLKEKSGFAISKLNTDMSLSGRHMDFEHVSLSTLYSQLSAKYLKLSFLDYTDFSDFVNKIGINFSINPSLISFNDISFFATNLFGYDEKLNFSGHLSGQISNLKGDDILLAYSANTRLMANFTMMGLPDIKTAFMHYDIISMETNSEDLQNLKIPGGDHNTHLKLPATIAQLGTLRYSGKFTGYFDDFVAYGKFSTSLGEFSSDLLLKPDTAKTLYFQGKLKTKEFFLGKLMKQDSLVGRITMNANINGYTSKAGIFAKMEGLIDSLELNRYDYKNIKLAGTISGKVFDGSFNISDPNIKMDFLGKVNFSKENPEFAFTADVSRARPYYLHLINTDPSYFASFLLETNFTGKTIDQFNGEIRIVNSLFSNKDNQLQMYDFSLLAVNTPDSNRILIRSDVIDGEVKGRYQFSTLPLSFRNLAGYYIPSLEKNPGEIVDYVDNNNFDFTIKLKDIHPLITFFLPDLDLGNNTDLTGHYYPGLKDAELNLSSSMFTYKGNEWQDLLIHTHSDEQTVTLSATGSALIFSNKMVLDSLVINSQLSKDTATINLDWNSNTKPVYQGKINAIANLKRNDQTNNLVFGLHIDPSDLYFNDTLWQVSESMINIDSSSMAIDSLSIRNQDQNFLVYGSVSENPEDALRFSFKDMNLSALNTFSKKIKITLGGKISGQASIKDPFHNITFLSDLQMDELFINGEDIGKGELLANWNNSNKKIHIKSFLGRGQTPGLQVEGDYYPQTKVMDFTMDLDKLKVNMFLPWASFLISDLKGIATGQLTLKGETQKPDLNGSLRLMKTSLIVNYLKTRYNFSNDVTIVHNNVIIKDFEVFDEKGNNAMVQGTVSTKYFKEYNLDIRLETGNFAFLNTTEKDNTLFYGRIFAGGVVRISGPTDNLLMNISARSERNSVFFIPLYATEEVAVRNFIDWVNPGDFEPEQTQSQASYDVKMKGLRMVINLEVTPDAEVQLIFDPKVGDIIKGRGTGSLKILINTLGKFEIYGDISIDEGDYLFTLQNVINKKFVVEKGGRISWNGDPRDANIDLRAIYGLKTTISELDPDPNQQTSRKRIPVECVINMSGKLMNPTIKPDITLPGADQQTQNIVKSSINTDEELMKQFVSLLVMNSFYSQQVFAQGGTANTSSNVAGVTTSELLSNQLSSWLSQISKDFDIGVNYRPGDLITSDELQVALSTQILNDRISISGNLDMGGNATGTSNTSNATNTNTIVGDFDINFKITDKLHVKAFNRANDNLLFQTSPYTQGVGLSYREYFNSLKELASRMKKTKVDPVSEEKSDRNSGFSKEE
jgi:hypothetical protein